MAIVQLRVAALVVSGVDSTLLPTEIKSLHLSRPALTKNSENDNSSLKATRISFFVRQYYLHLFARCSCSPPRMMVLAVTASRYSHLVVGEDEVLRCLCHMRILPYSIQDDNMCVFDCYSS